MSQPFFVRPAAPITFFRAVVLGKDAATTATSATIDGCSSGNISVTQRQRFRRYVLTVALLVIVVLGASISLSFEAVMLHQTHRVLMKQQLSEHAVVAAASAASSWLSAFRAIVSPIAAFAATNSSARAPGELSRNVRSLWDIPTLAAVNQDVDGSAIDAASTDGVPQGAVAASLVDALERLYTSDGLEPSGSDAWPLNRELRRTLDSLRSGLSRMEALLQDLGGPRTPSPSPNDSRAMVASRLTAWISAGSSPTRLSAGGYTAPDDVTAQSPAFDWLVSTSPNERPDTTDPVLRRRWTPSRLRVTGSVAANILVARRGLDVVEGFLDVIVAQPKYLHAVQHALISTGARVASAADATVSGVTPLQRSKLLVELDLILGLSLPQHRFVRDALLVPSVARSSASPAGGVLPRLIFALQDAATISSTLALLPSTSAGTGPHGGSNAAAFFASRAPAFAERRWLHGADVSAKTDDNGALPAGSPGLTSYYDYQDVFSSPPSASQPGAFVSSRFHRTVIEALSFCSLVDTTIGSEGSAFAMARLLAQQSALVDNPSGASTPAEAVLADQTQAATWSALRPSAAAIFPDSERQAWTVAAEVVSSLSRGPVSAVLPSQRGVLRPQLAATAVAGGRSSSDSLLAGPVASQTDSFSLEDVSDDWLAATALGDGGGNCMPLVHDFLQQHYRDEQRLTAAASSNAARGSLAAGTVNEDTTQAQLIAQVLTKSNALQTAANNFYRALSSRYALAESRDALLAASSKGTLDEFFRGNAATDMVAAHRSLDSALLAALPVALSQFSIPGRSTQPPSVSLVEQRSMDLFSLQCVIVGVTAAITLMAWIAFFSAVSTLRREWRKAVSADLLRQEYEASVCAVYVLFPALRRAFATGNPHDVLPAMLGGAYQLAECATMAREENGLQQGRLAAIDTSTTLTGQLAQDVAGFTIAAHLSTAASIDAECRLMFDALAQGRDHEASSSLNAMPNDAWRAAMDLYDMFCEARMAIDDGCYGPLASAADGVVVASGTGLHRKTDLVGAFGGHGAAVAGGTRSAMAILRQRADATSTRVNEASRTAAAAAEVSSEALGGLKSGLVSNHLGGAVDVPIRRMPFMRGYAYLMSVAASLSGKLSASTSWVTHAVMRSSTVDKGQRRQLLRPHDGPTSAGDDAADDDDSSVISMSGTRIQPGREVGNRAATAALARRHALSLFPDATLRSQCAVQSRVVATLLAVDLRYMLSSRVAHCMRQPRAADGTDHDWTGLQRCYEDVAAILRDTTSRLGGVATRTVGDVAILAWGVNNDNSMDGSAARSRSDSAGRGTVSGASDMSSIGSIGNEALTAASDEAGSSDESSVLSNALVMSPAAKALAAALVLRHRLRSGYCAATSAGMLTRKFLGAERVLQATTEELERPSPGKPKKTPKKNAVLQAVVQTILVEHPVGFRQSTETDSDDAEEDGPQASPQKRHARLTGDELPYPVFAIVQGFVAVGTMTSVSTSAPSASARNAADSNLATRKAHRHSRTRTSAKRRTEESSQVPLPGEDQEAEGSGVAKQDVRRPSSTLGSGTATADGCSASRLGISGCRSFTVHLPKAIHDDIHGLLHLASDGSLFGSDIVLNEGAMQSLHGHQALQAAYRAGRHHSQQLVHLCNVISEEFATSGGFLIPTGETDPASNLPRRFSSNSRALRKISSHESLGSGEMAVAVSSRLDFASLLQRGLSLDTSTGQPQQQASDIGGAALLVRLVGHMPTNLTHQALAAAFTGPSGSSARREASFSNTATKGNVRGLDDEHQAGNVGGGAAGLQESNGVGGVSKGPMAAAEQPLSLRSPFGGWSASTQVGRIAAIYVLSETEYERQRQEPLTPPPTGGQRSTPTTSAEAATTSHPWLSLLDAVAEALRDGQPRKALIAVDDYLRKNRGGKSNSFYVHAGSYSTPAALQRSSSGVSDKQRVSSYGSSAVVDDDAAPEDVPLQSLIRVLNVTAQWSAM